jgi:glyoxylase-like metal-dependent hydrolase (beta-lactamase superfamily II)
MMIEEFQPLTDHVWYFPDNPDADIVQPGVGAIISGDTTVLVDAGNSPRLARRIRAALRDLDAPPVKYVIYTHHHWDHTFGAQVWHGATVIAHERCRSLLQERYSGQPWNPMRVEEELRLNPDRASALRTLVRAIGDWQTFEVVLPHLTFTGQLSLVLDDLTINLCHVGGQHAPDSITVEANEVLFIGDCYYPPPQSVNATDEMLDFEMVQALLGQNARHYVEGHHQAFTHTEFSKLLKKR